ncbi:MAG: DUF2079 domain-containing protein, partial [bacterium]|nr:DUF2079 domain-containing protein [bacterium]
MVASRPRPAVQAALRRLPPVAPVLTAVVVSGAVSGTLLSRAERLQVPAYDTAFFEQLVWNAGQGRGLASGYYGASFLGLHFSPLLIGPAALEQLWPDVRLLGLLGALGLALSAPAAYMLLRALLGTRGRWLAAGLGVAVPLTSAVQNAAGAGFHTEDLALPLLLLMGWAGLRGRWWACWGCAVLALSAKEDQAYAVAVVGLLLARRGPQPRQGMALVAAALGWAAAVALVVMPVLRDGVASDVASYYAWLHGASPAELAAALARPGGWGVLLATIAGLAGLPLLRPAWLALALPPLLGSLLSTHAPQPELHLQYGLPLVVPLVVAGGLGGERLLGWEPPHLLRDRPPLLAWALVLPALVAVPFAVRSGFGSLPERAPSDPA